MIINEKGYWDRMSAKDIAKEHAFDNRLCQELITFFKNEKAQSIVDLGCGLGHYTHQLQNVVETCDGFDGNPFTKELTNGKCNVLDLTDPHKFETQYDWVLSLEVGEHIPKTYEDIFIDNLSENCINGIVLSWAVKGQSGCGHVNCQNNDYIIDKFKSKNFTYDSDASQKLRKSSSLSWFKNTIMVFRKL